MTTLSLLLSLFFPVVLAYVPFDYIKSEMKLIRKPATLFNNNDIKIFYPKSPVKMFSSSVIRKIPSDMLARFPTSSHLSINSDLTKLPTQQKLKETQSNKIFRAYTQLSNWALNLFPLWTILFTVMGLHSPSSFSWFTTEYFTAALAALMLSMGITLTPTDFANVTKQPMTVLLQFILCYVMMPFIALLLGSSFNLDPTLIAGMVIVGAINGGQASNLCTFIARGNVALSVLMTTTTTFGAIFMTPMLCKGILGAVVPVDARGIALSTIQVVLAPIFIGMTTNRFAPEFVKKILPACPVVGIVSTCLLVGSAVSQVANPILSAGWSLQIPLMLLHLIGGVVGYSSSVLCGFDVTTSRTIAIETAMKSSALSFLLAKLHFGKYAARIPSAVSVVWMTLTGSMLAVLYRLFPIKKMEKKKNVNNDKHSKIS